MERLYTNDAAIAVAIAASPALLLAALFLLFDPEARRFARELAALVAGRRS